MEAWYLLGFSLVKLAKWKNASECMKNVEMLIEKFKVADPELLEGTKELRAAISKADTKMEDDGFDTYSEEDVSEEDDEKMS